MNKVSPKTMAYFHLAIVYVVWGSTYLAIRLAVRGDGAWPPFILGASRVFVAGLILLLIARLRGESLKITRAQMWLLFASGTFMWVIGNGMVNWSEQYIDSGLAALIIGSAPISVAIMEAFLDRKRPSALLVTSLIIGFAGLIVLTLPMLLEGMGGKFLGTILILVGVNCWNVGMILQQRKPTPLSPVASSGYQQLFATIGFVILALITREQIPNPSTAAWGAWVYLVIFGSLIAFTSLVNALKHLPAQIVATTAYVNPVIAVILGWLIVSEEITVYSLAGMALIFVGIFGVFKDKSKQ